MTTDQTSRLRTDSIEHSHSVFWPLTQYQPPTPNIYLSSDRWPALVSGLVAAIVWAVDRQLVEEPTEEQAPTLE